MMLQNTSMGRRALLAAPALALAPVPTRAQQANLVETGSQGWLFPVWDRIDRLDEPALRAVLQLVADAITALRAGRMEVTLCLIPSKKRMMRQFLPAGSTVSPVIDRRFSLTVAEARRAGALVPDLDARFREFMAREPTRPVFFKTDTHWTPVGAEVAGIEIARQMRENLRLPASPRPGTRLGNLRPMVLAAGDLTRYVPAPQRASFGPEESMIRQILAPEGGASLLDDDSFDTVIVGTSNVQPRFGFQPVLSNQLVRSVGLSWRPNNLGPFFTMLDYLRSEGFRQNRPRAMVWNLLEADMLTGSSNSAWGQSSMAPAAFLADIRRLLA